MDPIVEQAVADLECQICGVPAGTRCVYVSGDRAGTPSSVIHDVRDRVRGSGPKVTQRLRGA